MVARRKPRRTVRRRKPLANRPTGQVSVPRKHNLVVRFLHKRMEKNKKRRQAQANRLRRLDRTPITLKRANKGDWSTQDAFIRQQEKKASMKGKWGQAFDGSQYQLRPSKFKVPGFAPHDVEMRTRAHSRAKASTWVRQ
jgi:hypothetical protein